MDEVKTKCKVVIIGAGNVAWHLAKRLLKKQQQVVQVFSRTLEHAENLARICNAEAIGHLENVVLTADVYVLAVKDDALESVVKAMPKVKGLVLHTSGSAEINVLDRFAQHGVFYPLQTFTKENKVSWKKTPLFLEANTIKSEMLLEKFAFLFSKQVFWISSSERLSIHLAAVVTCNFSNYLYTLAHQFLKAKADPMYFKYLLPLMEQTLEKVKTMHPSEAQTGPAIRGDVQTMQKHLALLENSPVLKKVYVRMSEGIAQEGRRSSYQNKVKNG